MRIECWLIDDIFNIYLKMELKNFVIYFCFVFEKAMYELFFALVQNIGN